MSGVTKRSIVILGATGSIGASAVDVIMRHPERFQVAALSAQRQWQVLLELLRRTRAPYAAMLDARAARELGDALRREDLPTRVLQGEEGLCAIATLAEADTVIAGIVGAAGLAPTLAAARAGKRILLANKETLVLGGHLFIEAAREGDATILPIDSEHNAIFQCLPPKRTGGAADCGVRRIVLTASGGPFRSTPIAELEQVTPDAACAHPNWRMGRKISVDSATMMNKGLEVIEAHWLFGAEADAIDVVIHPQSIVHSLVEYVDGSVLAQLGNPDMRTPIAQGLAWPDRIDAGVATLDLARVGALNFALPDAHRFPCLGLAYAALRHGGTAPAVLNAANEVAVAAFLDGRIGFLDIAVTCERTLSHIDPKPLTSFAEALDADEEARRVARQLLCSLNTHRLSA